MQKICYTILLTFALVASNTAVWAQRNFLNLVKTITDANATSQHSDFVELGAYTYFLSTTNTPNGSLLQSVQETDGTPSGTRQVLSMTTLPNANTSVNSMQV